MKTCSIIFFSIVIIICIIIFSMMGPFLGIFKLIFNFPRDEQQNTDGFSDEIINVQEADIPYSEEAEDDSFSYISSASKLLEYYTNNEILDLSNNEIRIMMNKYNSSYFEKKILIIVYLEESNQCIGHTVENFHKTNKCYLQIKSNIDQNKEIENEQKAWIVFVECKRGNNPENTLAIENTTKIIKKPVEETNVLEKMKDSPFIEFVIFLLLGLGIYYAL